jgi:alpha-glucosidase
MHNFLKDQPQLNVHNPHVQEALLDIVRFWLDRGVDGFRVDAINFAMHDPELRDNPPAPPGSGARTRPFDFQLKQYNQSHPDIPKFVERIRLLTDHYASRFTVAEVGGSDPDREMKAFTEGETHFNSAYGFDFLYAEKLTPTLVQHALAKWPDVADIGWPSWALSNHDAPRWISRWAPPHAQETYAQMVMMLFIALRGNIILWQGEELGLTQVDIPFDKLQDPEAIANWPLTLSRDGTRTPMPWVAQDEHGGFSAAEPWLPLGEANAARAVDKQEHDPAAMLNLTRRLIALRNANEALLLGDLQVMEASDDLLVFERSSADQHVICAYNFGEEPLHWSPPQPDRWRVIESVNGAGAWELPGFGGLIAERIA